jgi:hypothetical protein
MIVFPTRCVPRNNFCSWPRLPPPQGRLSLPIRATGCSNLPFVQSPLSYLMGTSLHVTWVVLVFLHTLISAVSNICIGSPLYCLQSKNGSAAFFYTPCPTHVPYFSVHAAQFKHSDIHLAFYCICYTSLPFNS